MFHRDYEFLLFTENEVINDNIAIKIFEDFQDIAGFDGKDRQLIYDDESGNWTFRFRCDNALELDDKYDLFIDESE